MDAKRKQVVAQYNVIVHMASTIAKLYADKASLYADNCISVDELVEMEGESSLSLMDTLGNILNNRDAVTEEDEWAFPVLERGQEMFGPHQPKDRAE